MSEQEENGEDNGFETEPETRTREGVESERRTERELEEGERFPTERET